jgi:hypothetical protein
MRFAEISTKTVRESKMQPTQKNLSILYNYSLDSMLVKELYKSAGTVARIQREIKLLDDVDKRRLTGSSTSNPHSQKEYHK